MSNKQIGYDHKKSALTIYLPLADERSVGFALLRESNRVAVRKRPMFFLIQKVWLAVI